MEGTWWYQVEFGAASGVGLGEYKTVTIINNTVSHLWSRRAISVTYARGLLRQSHMP